MRFVSSFFAAALFAAATPAIATVSAASPLSVVSALQAAGYKAMLEKDSSGDPMIATAMSGSNVRVYFYGCTAGRDCRSLQFSVGFDTKDGLALAKVNEWHKTHRWGQVYLDTDNDPFIQQDLMTAPAGIPDATFQQVVSTYEKSLADFKTFIGFN